MIRKKDYAREERKAWNDDKTYAEAARIKLLILTAERNEIRCALDNLVNLKKWKEIYGKDEIYLKNQPLLWDKAKEVLAKYGI